MNFTAEDFIREHTVISPVSQIPEIQIYTALEASPLWQMTKERLQQGGLPPPFWALAWPGGQGLARFILDHSEIFRDKRVLDFAAGSGVAAIAAKNAGASKVYASEIDPIAIAAIRMNSSLNGVTVDTLETNDFEIPYQDIDIIMAGDVCYQQAMSTKMMRRFIRCYEKGIQVFVGDPGRAYVPREGLTERARYEIKTSIELESCEWRTVIIWEMTGPVEANSA